MNVRDWLYVDDHCAAIALVLQSGRLGETYNVGGGREMTNVELVKLICNEIDRKFAFDKTLAGRYPAVSGGEPAQLRGINNIRQGPARA